MKEEQASKGANIRGSYWECNMRNIKHAKKKVKQGVWEANIGQMIGIELYDWMMVSRAEADLTTEAGLTAQTTPHDRINVVLVTLGTKTLDKEYAIDYAKELKESGPNLDLDLASRVFGHQKWG